MGNQMRQLPRIELRDLSIESSQMYGFELRGIDAPLLRCDLQPGENGWCVAVDVAALIIANDPACPVDQCQIFLEVKKNAGLGFVYQSVLEGK